MTGARRAVPLLGLTQIVGYGTLIYAVVLTAPRIAEDMGWSRALTLGGLSFGLLVAGLLSPHVGARIESWGGRRVMATGSLVAALGLAAMASVSHPLAYFAVWGVLGAAMSMALYDPAFATLGTLFREGARSRITALTLIAGFASTLSWPVTHWLLEALDWRGTYLVYAGAMLGLALPAHLLLPVPPRDAEATTARSAPTPAAGDHLFADAAARGARAAFWGLAIGFSANAFLFIGLSAHLLAVFIDLGLAAAAAVTVGTVIGPSQVGARMLEFAVARRVSPLIVGLTAAATLPLAFLLLATLGLTPASAAAFAVLYGGANGLVTIVRGTLPLALFGPDGYARLLGRIARPVLITGALAPFAMGAAIDLAGPTAPLLLGFAAACLSFAGLAWVVAVRRRVHASRAT
ncbi:MFS transporter [Stappia sp.]|uniref:MFS transporter n=1 Tax=Stappia sp. TaxID=1870903 RepID=UPI0032D9A1F8